MNDEYYKLNKENGDSYEPGKLDFQFDVLEEEYYSVTKTFPYNFRASFFIQIISYVEFQLRRICNHHHFKCATRISVKDLKGNSDLEKCKLYLTKICNIDFNKLNPEWQFIQDAKEIRNLFIHHRGEFKNGNDNRTKRIKNFIKSRDSIRLKPKTIFKNGEIVETEDGTVIIQHKGANAELLEKTKKFLEKLLKTELKYSTQ